MQKVSIVIPIYNEENILDISITSLLKELHKIPALRFEILLIQNGSKDKTKYIARQLSKKNSSIKLLNLHSPSFGDAFKYGARNAKYPFVILFNADWWDTKFLKTAIPLLKNNAIVVGSKSLDKSTDKRPYIRKVGSQLLTYALHLFFKYKGSDSHGLKAFRKKELQILIQSCITHEIIESELLIRANAKGLKIREIPVSIKEIRPPRLGFLYRCFRVFNEVLYLYRNYKIKI